MEGLIKGIVDIAIGHDDRDDQPRNNDAIEERSRSTWAEVVSGENEDGGDRRRQDHSSQTDRRNHNQWKPAEHQSYGRRHESQFTETRPSALQSHQNYGEDGQTWKHDYNQRQEESEGGWQTVPKKHPKKIKKVHQDNWDSFKRPASEQEYSNEVEENSRIEPSDEELSDLSRACSKLWEIDLNRLVPGKDYQIDCGEGKKVYCKDDMAEGSLFTWLKDDVLRRPTISRFFALLDNYNPHEGHKEVVTEEEKQEQAAFIEEISRTAPIKYLYKYLSSKGIISGGYNEFKRLLIDLWFSLCNRGGTYGSSSAFEHVFVGEIKQREEAQVSGFHNWIQFYLEEAKGRVDYQGYILPRRRGEFPDSETQLLTLQFEWNGVLKSVSSSFIGVSPEFEVALYTLCFFAGGEDNFVQLGPYNVNIKCYRLGNKIGSAFPIAD